jgi:hypothetical protein
MDFSDDFERMIPINAAEFKHIHMLNYPISKTELIMKKMVRQIAYICIRDNFVTNIISRFVYVV